MKPLIPDEISQWIGVKKKQEEKTYTMQSGPISVQNRRSIFVLYVMNAERGKMNEWMNEWTNYLEWELRMLSGYVHIRKKQLKHGRVKDCIRWESNDWVVARERLEKKPVSIKNQKHHTGGRSMGLGWSNKIEKGSMSNRGVDYLFGDTFHRLHYGDTDSRGWRSSVGADNDRRRHRRRQWGRRWRWRDCFCHSTAVDRGLAWTRTRQAVRPDRCPWDSWTRIRTRLIQIFVSAAIVQEQIQ